MANLIVRNVEEDIVKALKSRSGKHGISAEEEHRRILRRALLEPRQKRWAFLKQVVRELELEAEVRRERYQDHRCDAGSYDAVTARALGSYDALLQWSETTVRPGGKVVLWLTDAVAEEIEASDCWRVLSSRLPALERGRLVQYQACFT